MGPESCGKDIISQHLRCNLSLFTFLGSSGAPWRWHNGPFHSEWCQVCTLYPEKKFRSLLVNPCRFLLTMPVESMSQITASIHRNDLGGNSTSIDFSMGMGNKFWCSSTRDRFKVTTLRGQRDKKPSTGCDSNPRSHDHLMSSPPLCCNHYSALKLTYTSKWNSFERG